MAYIDPLVVASAGTGGGLAPLSQKALGRVRVHAGGYFFRIGGGVPFFGFFNFPISPLCARNEFKGTQCCTRRARTRRPVIAQLKLGNVLVLFFFRYYF